MRNKVTFARCYIMAISIFVTPTFVHDPVWSDSSTPSLGPSVEFIAAILTRYNGFRCCTSHRNGLSTDKSSSVTGPVPLRTETPGR